jgi:hypothetical protein
LDVLLNAFEGEIYARRPDSANDAVPGNNTVRMLLDLMNGLELKGIELGVDYKSVLALAKGLN